MTVEKDILLSLLRLTRSGPVRRESISKHAKVPLEMTASVLEKFSRKELLQQYGDVIETSPSQRVRMAVHALRLGADFEHVCSLLTWAEFEGIAAQALEANGYGTMRNFHFKHASRKWEIDILGLKNPLILCMDCKHWRRGWRQAATVKAVESQTERTQALTEALPEYYQRLKLEDWKNSILVPVVLSLAQGPYKLYDNVPIVPVLQLQDFINELPLEVNSLRHF